MDNKIYASYADYDNTPQHVIDKVLNNQLSKQIGGFKQYDGQRIVLDIKYYKEICDRSYNEVAYMHILSAEITLVNKDDVKFYVPPLIFPIETKSRWDRFKHS